MNKETYLHTFRKVIDSLDKKALKEMEIEAAVVEVLECVVIKIYKRAWATPKSDPLTARSRIFFSIWADDRCINEQKVFYNIHALKLRELPGYKLESKKFALAFRKSFAPFKSACPHVSTQYGPLTLMQGWTPIHEANFTEEILQFCIQFLEIAPLIDHALEKFK